jgi:putative membrane protein
MKWLLLPAVTAMLVASCSPRDNRAGTTAGSDRETGLRRDSTSGVTASDTAATSRNNAAQPTPTGAANPSGAGGESNEAAAILSQLYTADEAEVQEAKAAETKATNPQVKRFARKLVQDHQMNASEARTIAKRLGVNLTAGAGATSESQSAAAGEMAGKTGADFDRAFVERQVQEHQQNIDKIEHQMLPAAKDPQVKAYLQKTDKAMKTHLQLAQQLEQQLGKSSS